MNNRLWLKGRFEAIRALGTEPARTLVLDNYADYMRHEGFADIREQLARERRRAALTPRPLETPAP